MLSRDLGVDLGTSGVRIFQKGRGVVVDEPSLVARVKATGEPKAFGHAAQEMMGRTPDTIEVVAPIQNGAIAFYTLTESLLRWAFERAQGRYKLWKPRVIVAVPSGATGVERAALVDACRAAGAKEAWPLEAPMAAALGLGLGVGEPEGNMVVNVGGGTTDVAVIALGGVVVSDAVRVGSQQMDDAIYRHAKRVRSILLGERTAQEIKLTIGSAWPLEGEEDFQQEIEVRGRDLGNAMPRLVTLTSTEVREALSDPLNRIATCVRTALERTPPELVNDIARNGIWLAGGGARLPGLHRKLEQETGLEVHLPDRPESAVVNGVGRALDQIDALAQV